MNEIEKSSTCERADDLISVLYGEANERETREFEVHLKQCNSCRAEFASFAQVRESIGEWRDEALTGFVSAHAAPAPVRKSAIAALRRFFDLSPLWMKGAVGFAALIFCLLAVLAVVRLQPNDAPAVVKSDKVYSEQDVDQIVKEALAQQQRTQQTVTPEPIIVETLPAKDSNTAKPVQLPKARRPFSRAEREQLAADLRLLTSRDDEDLDLLGDRINK
jgi:anti-sigma factor RsiW